MRQRFSALVALGSIMVSAAAFAGPCWESEVTSSGKIWETPDQVFYRETTTMSAIVVGPESASYSEAEQFCASQGMRLPAMADIPFIEQYEAREVIQAVRRTSWLSDDGGLSNFPSKRLYSGSNRAIGWGWLPANFAVFCFAPGA